VIHAEAQRRGEKKEEMVVALFSSSPRLRVNKNRVSLRGNDEEGREPLSARSPGPLGA
jgi:hypothetical protein